MCTCGWGLLDDVINSECVCAMVCVWGGRVWVHVYVYMGECSTYSGEFRLSPSVVRSLERNRSTHTQRESPATGGNIIGK